MVNAMPEAPSVPRHRFNPSNHSNRSRDHAPRSPGEATVLPNTPAPSEEDPPPYSRHPSGTKKKEDEMGIGDDKEVWIVTPPGYNINPPKEACFNNYTELVTRGITINTTINNNIRPGDESGNNSGIRGTLSDFASGFSAHGLHRIYNSGPVKRFMWLAVCIFLVVYGAIQCYNTIAEYQTFPTKVSIELKQERKAEFPAITVCNLNPVNSKNKISKHPVWSAFKEVEGEQNNADCETDFGIFEEMYNFIQVEDSSFIDDYTMYSSGYGDDYYWDYYYDTGSGSGSGSSWSPEGTTSSWGSVGNSESSTSQGSSSSSSSTSPGSMGASSTSTPAVEGQSDSSVSPSPSSSSSDPSSSSFSSSPSSSSSPSFTTPSGDVSSEASEEPFVDDTARRRRSAPLNLLRPQPKPEGGTPKKGHPRDVAAKGKEKVSGVKKEHRRVKRSEKKAEEMTCRPDPKKKVSNATMWAIREKCSPSYISSYLNRNPEEIIPECPEADYKENTIFHAFCHEYVFMDKYGCFDNNGNVFIEERKFDLERRSFRLCPSCHYGCYDDPSVSLYSESGEVTKDMLYEWINSSKTTDSSDIISTLTLSKNDSVSFASEGKDFIVTCSFDRKHCSHIDFYSWTSSEYGMCYTFNTNFKFIKMKNKRIPMPIRKTENVGYANGLRLTLNINTKNYLSLLSPDVGVRLVVHNPKVAPFPEDEGFNVSPGYTTSVGIKKKVIERARELKGKCREDLIANRYNYTATLGLKLCKERWIRKTCNCTSSENPAFSSLNTEFENLVRCSAFNERQDLCWKRLESEMSAGNITCKLEMPCSETVYSTHVTMSVPNLDFYKIVQNIRKRNMGTDLCSESHNDTVRLHVYLESLAYEKITESPAYTINTFIANVGGNLGLFIGMSLVTVIEVIELIVDLIIAVFPIRRRKDDSRVEELPRAQLTEQQTPTVHRVILQRSPSSLGTSESSCQTMVTLHPLGQDTGWRRPTRDEADSAFNKLFMSA